MIYGNKDKYEQYSIHYCFYLKKLINQKPLNDIYFI